ncbi:TPA: hypothetical protein ACG4ML_000663 [Stenotrophomonas maltophilia]|nr:hypothetical protein [Stenotrophomonas maltophilia]HEJ3239975.1 hypothetical protein [Pseudomonas aeruginosa]HDS1372587.1 hypothetical protein [Stenotrophomonas maltophilia]HDS1376512.1 hypothetical protein [Stenotrophomonas maltophilia]HDS1381366.1 hypothetical protein [Stenotrophomonas maltophilia]
MRELHRGEGAEQQLETVGGCQIHAVQPYPRAGQVGTNNSAGQQQPVPLGQVRAVDDRRFKLHRGRPSANDGRMPQAGAAGNSLERVPA